jgi:hypothetical protein
LDIEHTFEGPAITETTKPSFAAGTHLRVNFGLYQHHGIAVGDDSVIHFGRGIFDLENAIVEQVEFETFCQGKPVQVVESEVGFTLEEVVSRATSRLGESNYDLVSNNCEHFVNWCRSGKHESQQSNLGETVARQSVAIAAKPMFRQWLARRASGKLSAVTVGLSRGPVVAASVGDAIQTTAEVVANRTGQSQVQSQKIGQRAGLASSAALGWAMGGPVTAAAGVGFWVFGQLAAIETVEVGKQLISKATSQATSQAANKHSKKESQDADSGDNVEKI